MSCDNMVSPGHIKEDNQECIFQVISIAPMQSQITLQEDTNLFFTLPKRLSLFFFQHSDRQIIKS